MSGKTKRKIFKVGRSHVMTLPPEWVKQIETENVLVLFDQYLLVLPDNKQPVVDEIIEGAIKAVVRGGTQDLEAGEYKAKAEV